MMIAELEQIAIPKVLRGREDGHTPAGDKMLLNDEFNNALHPVERVYGILGKPGSTDEYLAEVRGR